MKVLIGKPGEVDAEPRVHFWLEVYGGNAIFLRAQVAGGDDQVVLSLGPTGIRVSSLYDESLCAALGIARGSAVAVSA